MREGGEQLIHNAEFVSAEGRSRFCNIYNRINKVRDFDLCRSPREFDAGLHALFGKIALGDFNPLGRNMLSFKVLHRFYGGVFRDDQNPAGWAS